MTTENRNPLPIKKIVALASGKGGVGKSTLTANLAYAMKELGLRVGILDCDVYGPSIPTLMTDKTSTPHKDSTEKTTEQITEQATGPARLQPALRNGIQYISIGSLIDASTALMWRGPMVQNAILQMLYQTAWQTLDILLIDMPPGTGDAHLAIAQKSPINGVVIVSTPQDLALIDAERVIQMFRRLRIKILGLIENMSYFICPACQSTSHIFDHGGAQKKATSIGEKFLGQIPLDLELRIASDHGEWIGEKMPKNEISQHFIEIAKKIQREIK